MKSRKPSPAQIVYFPKKIARTVSRVQTVPELALADVAHSVEQKNAESKNAESIHDSKTELIELAAEPAAAAPKKRKRTKSGSQPAVEPARVFADMAALGHELFSQGKIAEAKVIFEGLAASSADSFVFTMLGTIHLAHNDLAKALSRFEEALKLDPDDLAALVYRAEIRLQKRRPRQAIEDLERAVRLGPTTEPFVARARRLLQLARKSNKR